MLVCLTRAASVTAFSRAEQQLQARVEPEGGRKSVYAQL